jgi:hypothetical protein
MSNPTISSPESVARLVRWMYKDEIITPIIGVVVLDSKFSAVHIEKIASGYDALAYGAYTNPLWYIKDLCRLNGDSIIVFRYSDITKFSMVDCIFVRQMRGALQMLKSDLTDFVTVDTVSDTVRSFRVESDKPSLKPFWDINYLYEKGILQ